MTARERLKERVFAEIDDEELLDSLRRAVQTPSVTLTEGAFGELLERELGEIGLDRIESFDFVPGRPNVWGQLTGSGGRRLLFAGHTDTVAVEGWAERWRGTAKEYPFSGALEHGAVWGRGAADMKAGIVASLAALRAVKRAEVRLRGDVLVAFVGDEESGIPGSGRSAGMRAIIDKIGNGEMPRPDFVIYAEPTMLDVYPAQIGFLIAEVVVTGRGAYFGLPWHGVDALKAAHRLLDRLFAYSDEIWARSDHPLLGRAFNLVTAIEAGGYVAVPERCTLRMIRKILPDETVEGARAELDGVIRLFAMNEGIEAAISYPAGRDSASGGRPAEVSADLEPVRLLAEVVREVTGKEEPISGAPYWSEASFFVHGLGVPTVYCGAGDILNCHTFEERVELRQLVDAVKVFALLMIDYCEGE